MAIRVRHGGVKEFAQLGALAGKADKSAREAEQAERRSLALQQHQVQRELAAEQVQVRKQLAQDAMQFEREKFLATKQFQMGLEFQREQHDFDLAENKRMEGQMEVEAAMKAIDGAEGYTPEEKSQQKALYMANRGGGQMSASAFGLGTQRETDPELVNNRLIQGMGKLRDELKEKVNFIGQFEDKKTLMGLGKTVTTRQSGKVKRNASNVEQLERQQAEKDIVAIRQQLAELNTQFEENLGVRQPKSPEEISQLQARVKEIQTAQPKSVEEAKTLIAELYQIDKNKGAALDAAWEGRFSTKRQVKKNAKKEERYNKMNQGQYRGTMFGQMYMGPN